MGTEARNPRSTGLHEMSALEIVKLMNAEESAVLDALGAAEGALALAVEKAAAAFSSGGRIVYVGAGTSGRVAAMDAAEMPPTFGIEPDRFIAIVPGGQKALMLAVEGAEDDADTGERAMDEAGIGPKDAVIGLAASGRTPYVLGAIRRAKALKAWTCGIANNPGTPLLTEADHGVLLDTDAEILTGSTRLKAGTAQKLALNRISTGAMVLCGKVHENLMIEVQPTNAKLRGRCIRIVRELTGLSEADAEARLEAANWSIREAAKT